MPELSEVKIMSDFVNAIGQKEMFFESIEKSTETKVKTDINNAFNGAVFTVNAQSRGKELQLIFEQVGGGKDAPVTRKLICNMGMSGNWVFLQKDAPQLPLAFKHGHIRMRSTKGNWLIMFDTRRYAKWRWQDDWSKNRGYCPLTEYNQFTETVKTHWLKHKDFNKPICDLLMSQKWFNGQGNYGRAETLYRLDVNPFMPFNQLTIGELNQLLTITHLAFRDTYQMGGGKDKGWYGNVNTTEDFTSWMKCYGNKQMSKVKDMSGRAFWFDPKWNEQAKDYLLAHTKKSK